MTGLGRLRPISEILYKDYMVSAHESTPINSRNNQSILSPVPNTGESHARQSRIRSPGQLLAATD